MRKTTGDDFNYLVGLLVRLRGPDGCPWDREQTHDSLKRHLLEESYEVLEAIDHRNPTQLADELGDVLLQILLHAQIASESDQFSISNVLESQRDKLIRRHPHVFGDTTVTGALEVEANWERLKRRERQGKEDSLLGRLPSEMPALAYSQLIQDRASSTGFDWDTIEGVLEKVTEEAQEIRNATSRKAQAREFGDLLFTLVNTGRWLGIHAENALRQANTRFCRRFSHMERLAMERGLSFVDLPLDQQEQLWQKAKAQDDDVAP